MRVYIVKKNHLGSVVSENLLLLYKGKTFEIYKNKTFEAKLSLKIIMVGAYQEILRVDILSNSIFKGLCQTYDFYNKGLL